MATIVPANLLISRIQRVLSPDLLQPQWLGNQHPLAGHCYVAAETLYHLLGGRLAGIKPFSAPCPGGQHWWIQQGGERLDPTAGQFDQETLLEIYSRGRGRGFLTKQPSKRAQHIIRLVSQGA